MVSLAEQEAFAVTHSLRPEPVTGVQSFVSTIPNLRSVQRPMPASDSCEVTGLLRAWSDGDECARDALIPMLYDELRRIAHSHLRREAHPDGLQTTALVHEAYLRLINVKSVRLESRAQFFALSAHLIRQVLVDQARMRLASKRGAGTIPVSLETVSFAASVTCADITNLDEALTRLERLSPKQKEIVELRVFGGLTHEEIAGVLKTSLRTVERNWTMARAWLQRELRVGG
jgi:RNA polymerase sigma factor (TIGR02999 family)